MVKHILGNAIYQIIVIYSLVFAGEHWFPEPIEEYQYENTPYVYPGRPYKWDMTPLYKDKEEEWGPSRHFTNVFNLFVWL